MKGKIFSQMKFISICFNCLRRGRDRNGHGRRAAGLQEAETPGSRPGGRTQACTGQAGGLCLSVLGTLLKSDCSLVEEKHRGRGGGGLQQKPEAWKGRTRERSARVGRREQRREAAARRHNIQIMVSPQHPCEVGWKVATIVMPTSQTRLGHRGKCTRGGLARPGGPSSLSGLPSIPAEPRPPATRNYLDMGDKDDAFF